jgi:hypothetical protein
MLKKSREGLKIRSLEKGVGVRVPLSAPKHLVWFQLITRANLPACVIRVVPLNFFQRCVRNMRFVHIPAPLSPAV